MVQNRSDLNKNVRHQISLQINEQVANPSKIRQKRGGPNMQDPFKMAHPPHLHMSVESGSILSGVSEPPPNMSHQIPPIKQMIYQ